MFYALSDFFSPVSLRALAAFFTALLIALACGSRLIEFLHHHQSKGQPIREDGPQSHLLTKKGTPTMGGLLILGSCIFSTLLWADLNNYFIWISLLVLLIYGTTGFVDDYVKVTKQTANAMTARMKLVLQFSTALIASAVISYATPEAYRYSLTIPYFRDLALNLCWFYIPFAMIVITGASNAVNLSDGLDGLASGLLICSFAVFMLIAYTCGTAVAPHFTAFVIPAAGEITVLCAAVIGGCLGFLWFNAPKAKVFMGDTGSLALGALLGTVAVMTKHEILLAIVGGVFVMETVSVMIQVAYFKKPAANASSKWPLFITILNSSAGPKRRSSSVFGLWRSFWPFWAWHPCSHCKKGDDRCFPFQETAVRKSPTGGGPLTKYCSR